MTTQPTHTHGVDRDKINLILISRRQQVNLRVWGWRLHLLLYLNTQEKENSLTYYVQTNAHGMTSVTEKT